MDERSRFLRRRIVDVLKEAKRGHVGAALSLVEIFRVLYDDVLRYDPKNPRWKDRDRCILSKGHGCLALYAILADKGFFPREELAKFCQPDGILGGHPEIKVPGVETSSGSLGHGLSIGLGMALNARYEKADYRVFVVMGDGECNEGSVWEAALSAGKHKLSNLTAIIDYNKMQSYATTAEVQNLEPFADKWRAFNFAVREVDGHDVSVLRQALKNIPIENGKPSVIICHTVKGKGFSGTECNLKWHHKNKISDEEIDQMYGELAR
ncbi:MAG: transketolase [Candidatus Omnitrophica bacterium]|nr:transketolase [Candidatus Omnitrophota bacterium]